jgi:hypothetical protein
MGPAVEKHISPLRSHFMQLHLFHLSVINLIPNAKRVLDIAYIMPRVGGKYTNMDNHCKQMIERRLIPLSTHVWHQVQCFRESN